MKQPGRLTGAAVPRGRRRLSVAWAVLLVMAAAWCAKPAAAQLDASCLASITLNFDPPAKLVLPPAQPPLSTAAGGGTISGCVVLDGGSTTGTFTFSLTGDLSCTSAENISGTLEIVWADDTDSQAEVSGLLMDLGSVGGAAGLAATITSGRFAGDQMAIVNVRDPLALVECALNGLSQTTATTSLTITPPL